MGRLRLSVGVVGKTVGFTLVGAAILATAVHVHRVEGRGRTAVGPATASDPLAPELARCQTIGASAETDRACDAAWAENRRRFFDGASAAARTYRPNTVNAVPKER